MILFDRVYHRLYVMSVDFIIHNNLFHDLDLIKFIYQLHYSDGQTVATSAQLLREVGCVPFEAETNS